MDGASGRPGSGPSSGTAYSGPLIVGTMFCVTEGGQWFEGYWWWVPGTNGDTASGQVFCLWQLASASTGMIVPGSTVTAGALTPDAWNFIPVSTPLLLSPSSGNSYGAVYNAATGKTFTSGFPETKNQFGSGDPYSAGIVNGPLAAPSSSGGSAAAGSAFSWTKPQCPFSTSSSDPTSAMPGQNDNDANLWLDIQVTDQAPSGASYRAFPNAPEFVVPGSSAQSAAYTLGLHFELTQESALTRIWHYSPAGVTVLPSRCAIWDAATQTEVAGTDNSSPAWSGAAGSGWVSCDYTSSGVTLATGTEYVVSTFTADNTDPWFLASASWWGGSPGPFSGGITQGPLEILANSAATPGNDSWHEGTTWTYPATSTNPEYDGLDVEVTPQSAPVTGTGTAAIDLAATASGESQRSGSGGAAIGLAATASGTSERAGTGLASLTLSASATGRSVRSGTGVAMLALAATGTAPAPAAPAQTGGWWGLHSVLEDRAMEFDWWAQLVETDGGEACPRDGEPLLPAPPGPSGAGSGINMYCKFCGWHSPQDVVRPVPGAMMGRDG
jgi:hypothetical protein